MVREWKTEYDEGRKVNKERKGEERREREREVGKRGNANRPENVCLL